MSAALRWLGNYLIRVLTVFDIMVQVLVFDGDPHETISDRAALRRQKGVRWGCVLCHALDWINPGHCDRALALISRPLIDLPDMTRLEADMDHLREIKATDEDWRLIYQILVDKEVQQVAGRMFALSAVKHVVQAIVEVVPEMKE